MTSPGPTPQRKKTMRIFPAQVPPGSTPGSDRLRSTRKSCPCRLTRLPLSTRGHQHPLSLHLLCFRAAAQTDSWSDCTTAVATRTTSSCPLGMDRTTTKKTSALQLPESESSTGTLTHMETTERFPADNPFPTRQPGSPVKQRNTMKGSNETTGPPTPIPTRMATLTPIPSARHVLQPAQAVMAMLTLILVATVWPPVTEPRPPPPKLLD